MFANQPNTLLEPVCTPMYASVQKHAENARATYGRPVREVRANIRGALREMARPYRARVEVYRSEEAADHAEVRSAALMTDGRPLMPALRMAMTKGEENAVDSAPRSRLFEGTSRPMMNVPTM